jgi:dTDP-4-dehydrorhamnose 3,5-epimerase
VKVTQTPIEGVLLIEPRVFGDARGFFTETFHAPRYAEAGLTAPFVQDNWSRSKRGTLRGLHFQLPREQGKLVMVTRGTVFDVVADVRKGSPTFGKWYGTELSETPFRQLWVPPGFAHGFCVLSEEADFLYKCTEVFVPADEQAIAWNDPDLNISWPVKAPTVSARDQAAPLLKDAKVLPQWSPK